MSSTCSRRARSRHGPPRAGSREMLELAAASLYARRVITASNVELARARRPRRNDARDAVGVACRGRRPVVSGQTEHAAARDRTASTGGRPPELPARRPRCATTRRHRDRSARTRGGRARRRSACLHLHPQGQRAALSKAFYGGGRSSSTEGAWRSHLSRWVGAAEVGVGKLGLGVVGGGGGGGGAVAGGAGRVAAATGSTSQARHRDPRLGRWVPLR